VWQYNVHGNLPSALVSHREVLDAFFVADVWQIRPQGVFMSQVGNSPESVGGEFMIQDRDHMSDSDQKASKANRNRSAQADQSQNETRQQGGSKSEKGSRQSH
jgi:hypothetical protein